MKAVVINLEKDIERLDRMSKRFNKLGIEFTRFAAITPDKVTREFGQELTPAQKACAQSHYEVWKQFLESEDEMLLVCEDDVLFRHDALDQILRGLNLVNRYDPLWHALFLNHSEDLNILESWTRIVNHVMAGAYILSRNGALFLVHTFSNKLVSADAMTGYVLQPQGHSYGYFPWLSIQEYIDTNISNNEHLMHDKVKRDTLLAKADYSLTNYF